MFSSHALFVFSVIATSTLISRTVAQDAAFIRGDTNQDQSFTLTDAVVVLQYLFQGLDDPACIDAADADDDGQVAITDAVYLLNFLFLGGPPPFSPFPECEHDPSSDELSCRQFSACDARCPAVDSDFPDCPDDTPAIRLAFVPCCLSGAHIRGSVCNIDPALFLIIAYDLVSGRWWGGKPSWANPLTPIAADFSFTVNVTTGGRDVFSESFFLAAVPADFVPPELHGTPSLPPELLAAAVASRVVARLCE